MNICSRNHDEVVFEVRECPVCEKMEKIDELVAKIEFLKDEIKVMESE